MIGTYDLVMGLVLVTVLFGAKRLPELAKSLGTSMKEFRKGMAEAEHGGDTSATTAVTTKTCTGCQQPVEAEWKHCPRCGTAIQ